MLDDIKAGRIKRNIVVLALSPLFGEVSSKGWVPKANVFGGVVKRVAQIWLYEKPGGQTENVFLSHRPI